MHKISSSVEVYEDDSLIEFKWAWLKNLLFKLKWIKNGWSDRTVYNVVQFNDKDLASKLLARYYSVQSYNIRPKHVYLGPEDFNELLDSKQVFDMGIAKIDFSVPISEGRRIFNLPVTVIPYMKGILFV